MPFTPSRHTLEIIRLGDGQFSPPGSDWIFLLPVAGVGIISRHGEYAHELEATQAAIDHAHVQRIGLLYVEA